MLIFEYQSPCGRLLLGVSGKFLCICDWMIAGRIEKTLRRIKKRLELGNAEDSREILSLAIRQLDEYFAGTRQIFDIPLKPLGTDFQCEVWRRLQAVAYGATTSYKAIAAATGSPQSVRAVSNAIGANALSIFIPCHRIIASDGTPGGYAGGLDAKEFLISLEKTYLNRK